MGSVAAADWLITAGDLKNWVYCQRVVYYRRFARDAAVPTYKMQSGVSAQETVERLEVRRGLARYGFAFGNRDATAVRKFGLWLTEPKLGLSGKIDLLLERWDDGAVVDFKLTAGEPGDNHAMQLAAYALLVEANLEITVPVGFIVRIPDEAVFEIALDAPLREKVRGAVDAIREMVENEVYPEPTPVRGRCTDCEYANFCGDVW